MFQVRFHGRGGQGVVTAAEILSVAAFAEGRHSQAFPSFGSERMGAPVVSFCRIDDRPIRTREPVMAPDALVVQDVTLLHQVDLFAGLLAGRLRPRQHLAELRRARPRRVRPQVPPRSPAHLSGDRARARTARPPACRTRRCSAASPPSPVRSRSTPSRRPSASASPARSASATSPRQPLPIDWSPAKKRSSPVLRQIEGSRAVAETVARCRPEVVCAYPISPQTHIIEAVGAMVKSGDALAVRVHQRRVGVRGDVGLDRRLGRRAPGPTPRPRARDCCS